MVTFAAGVEAPCVSGCHVLHCAKLVSFTLCVRNNLQHVLNVQGFNRKGVRARVQKHHERFCAQACDFVTALAPGHLGGNKIAPDAGLPLFPAGLAFSEFLGGGSSGMVIGATTRDGLDRAVKVRARLLHSVCWPPQVKPALWETGAHVTVHVMLLPSVCALVAKPQTAHTRALRLQLRRVPLPSHHQAQAVTHRNWPESSNAHAALQEFALTLAFSERGMGFVDGTGILFVPSEVEVMEPGTCEANTLSWTLPTRPGALSGDAKAWVDTLLAAAHRGCELRVKEFMVGMIMQLAHFGEARWWLRCL